MAEVFRPNSLVALDPSDERIFEGNWDDENLAASASITTSTWTITILKQNGATILTKDNASIQAGNRKTLVRLLATTATLGDRYVVANKIVTNETPAQTKERSFNVVIQQR